MVYRWCTYILQMVYTRVHLSRASSSVQVYTVVCRCKGDTLVKYLGVIQTTGHYPVVVLVVSSSSSSIQ